MDSRLSQFALGGFDVDAYIKNQLKSRNEDAIHELQVMLEEYKRNASIKLQSSVYRNYPQFIDASNQIANMEGDLLQLRNLLTEIRGVIKGLGDISSVATSASSSIGTLSGTLREPSMPNRVRRLELQAETQWALDALYDLDVLISERKFDEAVDLIADTSSRAKKSSHGTLVLQGVGVRAEKLADKLLDDLPSPLLSTAERRNIVSHLAGLGKVEKARDIYLGTQSRWIRQRVRQIKFEGDVTEYASELSSVVMSQLVFAIDDFKYLFQDSRLLSSMMVWISIELEKYSDSFARQVFHTDNFRIIAECLDSTYKSLILLNEKGVNMEVLVKKCFQPHLSQAIELYCARIQQSVEKRVENESWRGRELQIQDGVQDDHVVKLTDSAKYIYQATHRLISDLGRILDPSLYSSLSQGLTTILDDYLSTLSHRTYSDSLSEAQTLSIVGNGFFAVEDLIPRISKLLHRRFGHSLPSLDKLRLLLSKKHVSMRDSFATHRAHLLLDDEVQWTEGMMYSENAEIEHDLIKCDVASPGDHGLILKPTETFIHLIDCLVNLRDAVIRYVGGDVVDPILSSVSLEIAARLDSEKFWERNSGLSRSGLHQLVVDMRALLAALGDYASDNTVVFIERMIGKGVMDHVKAYGGDPTTVLLDDGWFELMVNSTVVPLQVPE